MGFYPTPPDTLEMILRKLKRDISGEGYYGSKSQILDPCCGEGEALLAVSNKLFPAAGWGVELDAERTAQVSQGLEVVQGSIFDVEIKPDGCMGLLWLNPPYDDSGLREREEMRFLKRSVQWLCPDGVLIFIVPELIFKQEKHRMWISGWFYDCSIFRIAQKEFGRFKQVVLFGRKRRTRHDNPPDLPCPPYRYLSFSHDGEDTLSYEVPATEGPEIFKCKFSLSDDEIIAAGSETENMIRRIILDENLAGGSLSPLFPLRKGHLVSLITAGYLNGKVSTGPDEKDFILIKGYSERKENTQIEDGKEITTNTYAVGVRVLDPRADDFYDIK